MYSRRQHNHVLLLLALQAAFVTTTTTDAFVLRPPSRRHDMNISSRLRLRSALDLSIDRRSCLMTSLICGTNACLLPSVSCAEATATTSSQITLPLELASGGTFCIRCTVFDSNKNSFQVYRTIVDTGSPYLVLPFAGNDSGRKKQQRFTKDDDVISLSPSDYPTTSEIYGSVTGNIDWKLASYSFRDPRLQIRQYSSQEITSAGVIGVLDEALTNEATGGGAIQPYGLLGLIQNSNPEADKTRFPDPRPTFFEQECIVDEDNNGSSNTEYRRIKSFCMHAPLRELTFSTESLINDQSDAMSLFDLRKYGDFVDHYAVKVKAISFDGITMSTKSIKRPIVAVFDSGLTDCLLIRPFWDHVQKYYATNVKDDASDVRDFHSVSISVKEMGGTVCNIKSSAVKDPRKFYVNPIDLDWFDDEATAPYVIILGQTFLSQGSLTIDMDKRLLTFQ